jgi:hypothetical protein
MRLREEFAAIQRIATLRESLQMDVYHLVAKQGVEAAVKLLKEKGLPKRAIDDMVRRAVQYCMSL